MSNRFFQRVYLLRVNMACVMVKWLFFLVILNLSFISFGHTKRGQQCDDGTVCEFVTKCPSALEKIKAGHFPEICGFEGLGTEALVCCSDVLPQTTEPIINRIGDIEKDEKVHFLEMKKKMSKAKKMCSSYVFKMCNGTFHVNKGRKATSDVVDSSEHPYMALIGYGKLWDIKWSCGGSLISEYYVLSAAHCAHTKYGKAEWVRLGETDLDKENSPHEDFKIVEHFVHPHYANPYVNNDIALFKLDMKVEFTKFIRPVCLETNPENKVSDVFATGFSLEDCPSFDCAQPEPAEHELVVSAVKSEFHTAKSCKKLFEDFEETSTGVNESGTICIQYSELHRIKCQGNPGDPLLYENREAGCPLTYNQVGILSVVGHWPHQYGCSFINSSSIYTKVSKYIPWIENIVWKHIQ